MHTGPTVNSKETTEVTPSLDYVCLAKFGEKYLKRRSITVEGCDASVTFELVQESYWKCVRP